MTTRASRAAHPSAQQLAPTSWALPPASRPPRLLWRARAARPCFTTPTLPRETACTTTRSNLGPAGLDQTGLPTWLHGSGNPNLSPPPPNLDKLTPQPPTPPPPPPQPQQQLHSEALPEYTPYTTSSPACAPSSTSAALLIRPSSNPPRPPGRCHLRLGLRACCIRHL